MLKWRSRQSTQVRPSSLAFFLRDVKFSRIVKYRSKFQKMDCTLNWNCIHYGGLHCDSKYEQKVILVSHTRSLKFISAPRKAKHFIGQLWQLMTASNVGAWTQAWQAKWAVFKIPGFVCKRFFPFFPTLSPFFACAICCAVFDSCSSFFAPKPHRNACYAG